MSDKAMMEAWKVLADEIVELREQQKELSARIAFVAPTEADIRREVEAFIERSLTA